MGVPFYEYRRPDGTTFEVLQKMSDDPLTHDPETGVPVERVFSPIAIHFKGKGFYNTDYGTKKRNREKASEKSSSGSSDSSSSSTDSSSSSTSSDGAKAGTSSSSSSSGTSSSSSSSGSDS
jgi:putative FmdB family regulatory protein